MKSVVRGMLMAALALAASACGTFQAYDGPTRPNSEVAIITGDAKLRTITPLALVIRSVDGRAVDVQFASVAVAPGEHELQVDCQVGGTDAASDSSVSRHSVQANVSAGQRYRLSADMQPGNRACQRVVLEPD